MTTSCCVEGCSGTPAGQCLQCGRTYCAAHGGRAAGYGECCRECYERVLQGLVLASHRAGRLADAAAALDRAQPARSAEHVYYQALALAEQDELDAAAERLEEVLTGSADASAVAPAARRLLGTVLSARAARRLQVQEVVGAVDDLRQAAQLLEDNATQRGLLASLVHQAALAYFQAGRLADARREWEAAQADDPQDVQLAHYLAIACYRLASETEEKDPAQAETVWQQAIANWAVVFANRDYWSAWAHGRARAVGPVEAGIIDEVRQKTIDRLRTEFIEYRNRYRQQGQAARAARHAARETELMCEIRAAEEMRAAMEAHGTSKNALRTACGPLMLARWRAIPGGADPAAAVDALTRATPSLHPYFSPLGASYVLVKDLHRYEDAAGELRAWIKKNPKDAPAKELLVEALVEHGQSLLDANDLEGAVRSLEEAAGLGVHRERALALLPDAATRYARQLLEDEKTYQRAIDLLERLQKAHSFKDPEFKAVWSQAYYKRGLQRNHQDKYAESLADVRRALEINPANSMAKENLVPALMMRAAELLKAERLDEAFKLCEEGLNVNPRQVNKDLLAAVLFQRGIKRANAAIASHQPWMTFSTIQALSEALKDLNTARELNSGDPSTRRHIQTQIDAITKVLSQLR